ncbi:MAG TPA: 1-acyl-sn-glycerol-3-phosphate acyltransferase [Thermoanaerobaculia bacterium]|jgi:1-acyl-sn-glycerol-3-phosphate acyltransferase
MRAAVTRFFAMCLRIFFRRIELVGLERVPREGGVVFAVNHPNALVDPLFLLCFAPRPVSFLAKAPLFRYRFIGLLVRAFDSIPVYRKEDHTTGSHDETFARSEAVLRGTGSIAIFPEGTTHDDPQLRELKTGAARIALGSSLPRVAVIPTGIYYTAKHVFRSDVLVMFGEPLEVVPGDVSVARVDALTAEIDRGLDAVTLQAESRAALELIAQAGEIFASEHELPLAEELELRRRFIDGYHYLAARDPQRLERLQSSVVQFAGELRRARLDVHDLAPAPLEPRRLFRIAVLLPLALIGAAVSWPTYRLIGFLARRLTREKAVVATIKFVAALLFYPLTYLAIAVFVGMRFGWLPGVAAALLLPLLGYVALRVFEDIDEVIGDVRALRHRPRERLIAERERIRREIADVAREITAAEPAAPTRG